MQCAHLFVDEDDDAAKQAAKRQRITRAHPTNRMPLSALLRHVLTQAAPGETPPDPWEAIIRKAVESKKGGLFLSPRCLQPSLRLLHCGTSLRTRASSFQYFSAEVDIDMEATWLKLRDFLRRKHNVHSSLFAIIAEKDNIFHELSITLFPPKPRFSQTWLWVHISSFRALAALVWQNKRKKTCLFPVIDATNSYKVQLSPCVIH